MDGYMTIGEVAKVKQISIKALRYYEKIGILKPAYCDPDTGYRYYKNEQMRNGAFRIRKNTGIVMDFTEERYRNGIF